MQKNYYPWNIEALLAWLDLEQSSFKSLQAFAQGLGIPYYTIKEWRTNAMPDITLSQIQQIARFRRWSLSQTFEWLELKQSHIDYLMQSCDQQST
ncbi:hypothetical protein PN498_18285 [Oscillatoria sp. CS-180]|uniref:hypothetical protein n=1 Tax=Oscillatoria sp. CS-180 TaxID=3021720 RepID=UPI00232E19AC|nr:hypothetical protein [Oscillatoria sp. CS-180]MDB9527948.1 hypothetical protein [Oscillatoria sp. CS-180]